jgi:ribosomal protein S18 acetylase RimI-like enzyme
MPETDDISFTEVQQLSMHEISATRFSFDIVEEALPPFSDTALTKVVPVRAYKKSYEFREEFAVVDSSKSSIIIAKASQELIVGFLVVSRSWNQCAQVDAFAVDAAYRGRQIGKRLMDHAVKWASTNGLNHIRLETQNNNVGACRFYEKYGFTLGGYDRLLYHAMKDNSKNEIALFYYLKHT